ncbi:hypothetical protein ACHAXR_007226 [Thalassiosira sp. AJA248-18]
MANKEPQSLDPPQCDEPSPASVSDADSHRKTAKPKRVDTIQMIPPNALPDPNQWEREKCSSTRGIHSCSEMVWDSSKARVARGQIDLLESIVPHDRKESALELFHDNDYQINEMKIYSRRSNKFITTDASSHQSHAKGTNSRIELVSINKESIFKENSQGGRKNFAAVSKRLKKTAGDCQAYYYSHFKGSGEYRKMKRALTRQVITRSASSRESPDVECARCNDVGELICCDICSSKFHLHCVIPTLSKVPSGNWFCEECDPKE